MSVIDYIALLYLLDEFNSPFKNVIIVDTHLTSIFMKQEQYLVRPKGMGLQAWDQMTGIRMIQLQARPRLHLDRYNLICDR